MNKSKKMKFSRNDLCPCGSGKKYKKCSLPKITSNKANENKSTRDSDFGFLINSVEYIDNEEEFKRELDSLLEIAHIQQELFQDAITKGIDITNFDQRKLKEQRRYKEIRT